MTFLDFFFPARDPAPPKIHVVRTAAWVSQSASRWSTTQALSSSRVKGQTLSSHTSISWCLSAVTPPPPHPPAVFQLSVPWRSPNTLQGAACFSLIHSRRVQAGSAMFFWINKTLTVLMRLHWLCVRACASVCERVRCDTSAAAILSERLLLAECPLIELVLILQLHSAF